MNNFHAVTSFAFKEGGEVPPFLLFPFGIQIEFVNARNAITTTAAGEWYHFHAIAAYFYTLLRLQQQQTPF